MQHTKYYQIKNIDNDKLYLDYKLEINWNVKNIINTDCIDGYIVQKVEIVNNTNISENYIRNIMYYEAWKVEDAKYINHSDFKADDTFKQSIIVESLGGKGKVVYLSEIYWIDKKNRLYQVVDNWKAGNIYEAGDLKSELYENCTDLHLYKPVYRREKFIHTIDFTDETVILESIKSYFSKRRYYKTKDFYLWLENELKNTPYAWISEKIKKDWKIYY